MIRKTPVEMWIENRKWDNPEAPTVPPFRLLSLDDLRDTATTTRRPLRARLRGIVGKVRALWARWEVRVYRFIAFLLVVLSAWVVLKAWVAFTVWAGKVLGVAS